MKQLIINETNARKFYKNPTNAFKEELETTFGKEFFSEKITDRVKTIEDVCKELGVDISTAWNTQTEEAHVVAYKQMVLIARALNEGWVANWDDSSEPKWYAWWYMDKPGFRLYGCLYDYSASTVGARLVFKSEALARYAAEQFKDIYKIFHCL